jgi:hypothetical protein
MNLLCWYIFIINAMRSCNERTTLHCVESYLYYIILVNKQIFSEEWHEGEKKIDNIHVQYIHCRIVSALFRQFDSFFGAIDTIHVHCRKIYNSFPLTAKQIRKSRQNSYIWILYFRQCIYCTCILSIFFSPSCHSSENICLLTKIM